MILQSSRKDNIHRQGVAILLSKEMALAMVDYDLHSERITSVIIETKTDPICILQIYASDTSYTDSEIELFYDELQSKINQLSSNHKYIILGDMNAKVGRDSYSNWTSLVGIYGVGDCNERGERLLQFCAINNLTIVNTLYKHNLLRRVTWTSPDGKTRNQIDYVIIQQNQ